MRRSRATLLATLAALASGWDSSSRMIWSEPLADPAAAAAAPSAAAPNDHGVTPHVRKIVDKMLRMTPDPSETMNSFQKFATTANVDLATARRFEPIEASVRMHSDSMAMMAGYLTSVKVRAASTDGDPEGDAYAFVKIFEKPGLTWGTGDIKVKPEYQIFGVEFNAAASDRLADFAREEGDPMTDFAE